MAILHTAHEKLKGTFRKTDVQDLYECTIEILIKLLAGSLFASLVLIMVVFSVAKFKVRGLELISPLIMSIHLAVQFWMDTHEGAFTKEVERTVEQHRSRRENSNKPNWH
ncbi:predicted protein [Naegleria gruberi]|uniref:Predicted protein n=1 Tax=Naegleria gruberi TaxID=5762 RepID=D2W5V6_NAEGR|nr:uncharacterized protein NAEGRDRAFT_76799 [Naegleria gruberi]EFC35547.1 predicted protein [Naegleria gruberi]|eukprot:XP_002668291.1 predicted protein [Naegleria gruberi strain NEG-M]